MERDTRRGDQATLGAASLRRRRGQDVDGLNGSDTSDTTEEPRTDHVDQLTQLARAAAAGSQTALETLLAAVVERRLIEPVVTRMLLNPADIDDAVQLTLITVAERIDSFEARAPFTRWLSRVARNEALMVLRRRTRKSEPTGEEPPEMWGVLRRISSLIANRDAVDRLLASLPPLYREVLVLREIEDLEYEEIATRLDVPVGTVRSRLARGREHLRQQAASVTR
jgi:RNA polymerase sigma-70 factor (ECF subfamily)